MAFALIPVSELYGEPNENMHAPHLKYVTVLKKGMTKKMFHMILS